VCVCVCVFRCECVCACLRVCVCVCVCVRVSKGGHVGHVLCIVLITAHLSSKCACARCRPAEHSLVHLTITPTPTSTPRHNAQVELLGANISANGSREQMSYTIDCLRRCVCVRACVFVRMCVYERVWAGRGMCIAWLAGVSCCVMPCQPEIPRKQRTPTLETAPHTHTHTHTHTPVRTQPRAGRAGAAV
jgi:hypothetical protein